MTSAAARPLLAARLARRSLPLQEQLYRRIRDAIVAGRLAPGDRLPATRALAGELGIARGTVDAVYARLAGEGYLLARGPAGTIVSPALRLGGPRPRAREIAPAPTTAAAAPPPLPFQMGLPALDLFPRALGARLTARAARRLGGATLAYPHPAGLPALRAALASYLAVSRGVAAEPAQVIVTGGYQPALSLLARLLLRPGDAVWFEEPGYFLARQALCAAGGRLVPVPVDGDGLDVARAAARAPDARLAVVTPAHQSPLGVALSLARRQALLAWAETAQAFVLEDDYDSEFHYVGRKLPALKSLDAADRVIYAGSFSKTLFPALRLGYLVVPRSLVAAITEALRISAHGEPLLGQQVAADFMAEGHFARHLKRMRGLYATRRAALAGALGDSFGDRVELSLQPGGMHLLLRLRAAGSDVALARRAAAQGLAPTPLSPHYLGRRRVQGLLLGFTNVPEPSAARRADALRRAVDQAL
jgi:GntR family transcriptional regulator/MocR family aminotransferase